MAKNYLVRMNKSAAGPKLEHKALDMGREYPISEKTARELDSDPKAKHEAGYKCAAFEILRELTESQVEEHREKVEEAKKSA